MRITLNSNNPEHYGKIFTGIPLIPNSSYAKITIQRVNCNCYIRVLSKNDYLTIKQTPIGGQRLNEPQSDIINVIKFDDYISMEPEAFAELLLSKFKDLDVDIEVSLDNCKRIIFNSPTKFSIIDATYNVKLILGLMYMIDKDYVLESTSINEKYYLKINSVGFSLSTPKLYLISNLGSFCYRQAPDTNEIQSCPIAMEIDNSFSTSMPIIACNGDISFVVPCNNISAATFTLTDANLHEIHLLTPMYITILVEESTTPHI